MRNCNRTSVAAPTVKLLINGEFVESKTTEWRRDASVNPATQEVLAQRTVRHRR